MLALARVWCCAIERIGHVRRMCVWCYYTQGRHARTRTDGCWLYVCRVGGSSRAWGHLEGAPVPVAGHAECDLGLALAGGRGAGAGHGARRDGARGHRLAALLGRPLARRARARGAGAVAAAPHLEVAVAVRAGAAQLAAGVVVCALVQGHLVRRVRVAKDVAAAPAVVASHEIVEVFFAGGVIADVGLVIGLFGGFFVSFVVACLEGL